MTDVTAHNTPTTRIRTPKTEFMIYFGIIFLAALPLATLSWVWAATTSRPTHRQGPIARAWSQARIITPMIFAA